MNKLKALVQIIRPEESEDKVLLTFNESAFRLVSGKPLMFEENREGILLTVPMVDHHKSTRVTFKKRFNIPTEIAQDFNSGEWYPIKEIDDEMFIIEVPWI